MFFHAQYFESFDYLFQQAKGFEVFHNQNHHCSTLGGKPLMEKSLALTLEFYLTLRIYDSKLLEKFDYSLLKTSIDLY